MDPQGKTDLMLWLSVSQQQQQQQQRRRLRLPPVHVNSSWIGNQWFPPPGYRLYNPHEIQDYFSQYSILFVGDSTGRRAYATLYSILNATTPSVSATKSDKDPTRPDLSFSSSLSSSSSSTVSPLLHDISVHDVNDPSVLNINKQIRKFRTEPCVERPTMLLCRYTPPDYRRYFDFRWNMCPDKTDLRDHIQDYQLVVVALGPWELVGRCGGQTVDEKWQHVQTMVDKLVGYARDYPAIRIVVRTTGNCGDAPESINQNYMTLQAALRLNRRLVEYVDTTPEIQEIPNLSVVDFGSIVLPHRSYPDNVRIHGDIPPHYGWEARLAFLQMLMNHLIVHDNDDNRHSGLDTSNDATGSAAQIPVGSEP